MYKCTNCNVTFEEPALFKEYHGEDSIFYEASYVCPMCGGDYEEAEECELCNENFFSDDLIYGVCPMCADKELTEENMRRFIKQDGTLFEDFVFWAKKRYEHERCS